MNPSSFGPVLFSEKEIRHRVISLAEDISKTYQKTLRDDPVVILGILNGGLIFLADLIRQFSFPLTLGCISASSYGRGTESSGVLTITHQLNLDVKNKRVLIVDDILDTGNTLKQLIDLIKVFRPRDYKTCVLLDKPSRRKRKIKADFVGFTVPNVFVVGYGLDYDQQYRNLPHITSLKFC